MYKHQLYYSTQHVVSVFIFSMFPNKKLELLFSEKKTLGLEFIQTFLKLGSVVLRGL